MKEFGGEPVRNSTEVRLKSGEVRKSANRFIEEHVISI